MDSISEWIRLAKAGDKKAFEELIIQHEKMVYNIAYRMLNSEEDAKDVAQEVLIKIYKSIKKFNSKSTFSTWIYRMTVNTCIDELRKKKKQASVSFDMECIENIANIDFKQETPEEFAVRKERAGVISAAVAALEADYKAVIVLRDINGFSYGDIAEILNINIGTVKSRIARARERLKSNITQSLEQYDENKRLKNRKEDLL